MMNFAICDDEPLMAGEIRRRLAAYMEERGVPDYRASAFSSGRQLLEDGGDFDMIFLDIQMERPDGLETAKALRRRNCRSLLVYVTVLRERVFDAFETEAFDYLVKPLEDGRFRRTMDRALKTLERRGAKSVAVRRGSACEVIPLERIVYCEVQGRKIYIHRADGKTVDFYERLDELERQVDGRFFRCHRSYLVNLEYVRGCRDGRVTLSQGEEIPVSRLRERDFTQALLRYMKGRED